MANVIKLKSSVVAGKIPTTSDISKGEVAVNYADAKIFGRHPSTDAIIELGGAAGSLSIDSTAADLFSASSGTLTADDPGADRLFFWDDSAGRATHLEVGSGLAITGTTLSNTAAGLSGTGSVDNAILRADGTGGATLQNSGIVIDDATTSTQNNVAITNQHSGQTNSALVLSPKGTGAFIAGPKPDGTATGGNARGSRAVDLQLQRNAANQVASGANSFIGGGRINRASGADAIVVGGSGNNSTGSDSPIIVGGSENTASGSNGSTVVGGYKNQASGQFSSFVGAGGHYSGSNVGNTASGNFSAVLCERGL